MHRLSVSTFRGAARAVESGKGENQNAVLCSGQSARLYQRIEGSDTQNRKISVPNRIPLVLPPKEKYRRASHAPLSFGSQGSYSRSVRPSPPDDSGGRHRTLTTHIPLIEDFDDSSKIDELDVKLPKISGVPTTKQQGNGGAEGKSARKSKKRKKGAANREGEKSTGQSPAESETNRGIHSELDGRDSRKTEPGEMDGLDYGLNMRNEIMLGLHLTRPFTYSYLPEIAPKKKGKKNRNKKKVRTVKSIL